MALRSLIEEKKLHTVCQSAHCPNIEECFNNGVATFMILGNICSRNCRFCNIAAGEPTEVDLKESLRIAQAVKKLRLNYAVITSVTRDDLGDGGAEQFARTIKTIKELNPGCQVEVLIPDFQGSIESLKKVVKEKPKVINHNIETVCRLYPLVRPQANYQSSLNLLKQIKPLDQDIFTKSGLIIGLGEEYEEILEAIDDLRKVQCDILSIGQYLQPSKEHLPVERYYSPQEFQELKKFALKAGFKWVEASPLARSSYHADDCCNM